MKPMADMMQAEAPFSSRYRHRSTNLEGCVVDRSSLRNDLGYCAAGIACCAWLDQICSRHNLQTQANWSLTIKTNLKQRTCKVLPPLFDLLGQVIESSCCSKPQTQQWPRLLLHCIADLITAALCYCSAKRADGICVERESLKFISDSAG